MSREQYKKYIVEMLSCIDDIKALERIYNVVHRIFINRFPTLEE